MATRQKGKKDKPGEHLIWVGGKIWYKRVIDGHLYRKTTGTSDPTMAKARRAQFDVEIERGEFDLEKTPVEPPPAVPTYAEYTQKIMAARTKQGYYRTAQRHTLAAWGPMPLDTILKTHCELYLADRKKVWVNQNTLRMEVTISQMVFNWARRDGRVGTDGKLIQNPWRGDGSKGSKVEIPKWKARRRVLDADEAARLLAIDPADDAQEAMLVRLYTVLVGTGLRISEGMNLYRKEPHDMPEDARYAWTNAFWTQLSVMGKGAKIRHIPLSPALALILKAQHEATLCGTLFPPMDYDTLRGKLYARCKRLRISPKVKPHDLRRTFGTNCANQGMPMPVLQELMGHSSITITAQFYVHLTSTNAKEWMARMDQTSFQAGADAAKALLPTPKKTEEV